jgi:hypothetical protein
MLAVCTRGRTKEKPTTYRLIITLMNAKRASRKVRRDSIKKCDKLQNNMRNS